MKTTYWSNKAYRKTHTNQKHIKNTNVTKRKTERKNNEKSVLAMYNII